MMFEMAAARRQNNRSIQAGGGGASCQQRLAVGLMAVGSDASRNIVTIGALALSCERAQSTRAFNGDKRRISHRVRGGQSSGRRWISHTV
jgi:hypothetical protein